MDILKTLLLGLQILSALGLLTIVMSQATKSEGLSGTIGGKAESAFRGKPGSDEKLREYTKWLAIGFMVVSAVSAYVIRLTS